MKRISVIVLLLAVCFAASVYAQESRLTMNIIPKIGMAPSEYQAYQTIDVEFNVMFEKLIGIGVEAGLEYGYLLNDSYITAVALVRLAWLYAGIGTYIKITNAILPANTEYIGINYAGSMSPIVLKLGLSIPIFQVGPGMLGLNAFAVMHDMDRPRKPDDSSWFLLPAMMPVFEVMYKIPMLN